MFFSLPPATRVLLLANVAMFVLESLSGSSGLIAYLALWPLGILAAFLVFGRRWSGRGLLLAGLAGAPFLALVLADLLGAPRQRPDGAAAAGGHRSERGWGAAGPVAGPAGGELRRQERRVASAPLTAAPAPAGGPGG